jgi:2-polyprenyl-3-methyl-5-hydroxy-6-metoxy-1,4-benzoquinol methylase
VTLLRKVVDNRDAGSLATRMRRRRFAFFLSLLDKVKRPARILDVGGTQDFWEVMGRSNLGDLRITLLNLQTQPVSGSNFESVKGDARDLSRYADGSFDVVFSNSVIEHLGPGFADQQLMANEIRRVGERYFVQTPNRHFPIEPHFLTPGFQFLPVSARVWAVTHFDLGWYKKFADRDEARREVESISLLTERQIRRLFPSALVYKEQFLGLTKSFVAYGGWAD